MAAPRLLDYEAPEPSVAVASQCTHRHRRGRRRGKRCRRATHYDYRWCDDHLARIHHLRVAPSLLGLGRDIAGLGLFARGRPPHSRHNVVFRRGDLIGVFGGELIDNHEYGRRYASTDRFARYVVGLDDATSHDETDVRSALSYANDGVNLDDPLMRRNYYFKGGGTHVVWHNTSWPYVINCACESTTGGSEPARACLRAIGDICDGDELLWSYSGSHLPSRDVDGDWVRDATTGDPVDAYWFGSEAATTGETTSVTTVNDLSSSELKPR